MRRTIVAAWNIPTEGIVPTLIILSICFLAGGLTGCLVAAQVGGAGETSLNAYLQAFFAGSSIWDCGRPNAVVSGLGRLALASAGPSAWSYRLGRLGPSHSLRSPWLFISLFHRILCTGIRRIWLAVSLFGVRHWGNLVPACPFYIRSAEFPVCPCFGRPSAGRGKGESPLGPGLPCPLCHVRRHSLCVYPAGADCGTRSAFQCGSYSCKLIERK